MFKDDIEYLRMSNRLLTEILRTAGEALTLEENKNLALIYSIKQALLELDKPSGSISDSIEHITNILHRALTNNV